MVDVYAICGERNSIDGNFLVDEARGARLLILEPTTSFLQLKNMLFEDYEFEERYMKIECSYVLGDLTNMSPPINIYSDRQVRNFVAYVTKKPSTQLWVTFKPRVDPGTNDINNEPRSCIGESSQKESKGLVHEDRAANVEKWASKVNRLALENIVKKGQTFESKGLLKSRMELCAMKHNFDYHVFKSTSEWWNIRCKDRLCNWRLRSIYVGKSKVFRITKYVPTHTCAPSSKTTGAKTASAKTIGKLIMRTYQSPLTDGLSPNEVIQHMEWQEGVKISYSLAFDAREYAINVVRGIPEKSYEKIPKYLYMLKAANLGTHYAFETDKNGRFLYLSLAFGQSIRGFQTCMRKVVIVDGTFLKNKYKGTLLVATCVDANNNLYPIVFAVVDSENDLSWGWFMKQLNVFIPDEEGLAFVSDINPSLVKAVETVFTRAKHGICIHHLLSNVTSNYQGKDMLDLVNKASKCYREVDFESKFAHICGLSEVVGTYLTKADVYKWARCYFPASRHDIRTKNPAESINSALRTPREYPIILLLDSIRELLTRWFNVGRTKSSKSTHLCTDEVEIKLARRFAKGKYFGVVKLSDDGAFHVKGDTLDHLVDLEKRTCSCGKYMMFKLPCRHAIKAGYTVGRTAHSLADDLYSTATWRRAYAESIYPIVVPEDEWRVPAEVEAAHMKPPETRRQAGRRRKRRYPGVQDKIQKNQIYKKPKQLRKCSRCGHFGHNKKTCDRKIKG